ncbi:unnamed protein product [Nezara viridula]|uniref:Neuropeptide n=1 Tax=Nezara viridula TaxID=85310 RepID=A0A9P0E796_NEZVI|nr:unnamed protein product [Nezara viridula]
MCLLTTSGFLILLHATYVNSEWNYYKQFYEERQQQQKGLKIDFKKFIVCDISCKLKKCLCCKGVSFFKGCLTSVLDPSIKLIVLALEINSNKLFDIKISANFTDVCLNTKYGDIGFGVCFNTIVKESYPNSISFKMCPIIFGHINHHRIISLEFSCWLYQGNLIVSNEHPFSIKPRISNISFIKNNTMESVEAFLKMAFGEHIWSKRN